MTFFSSLVRYFLVLVFPNISRAKKRSQTQIVNASSHSLFVRLHEVTKFLQPAVVFTLRNQLSTFVVFLSSGGASSSLDCAPNIFLWSVA